MNTQTLQQFAESLWEEYCEIFPTLVRFDCPKIKLNNRFTKTAGYARLTKNGVKLNTVELSSKFLAKFPDEMLNETLPHELAHFIDFNLNGWPVGKKGHDNVWKNIMLKIGKNPARLHTMVL